MAQSVMWDRTNAERFIRQVFSSLSGLENAPDSEVDSWTERAMATQDPAAIFAAITQLQEHAERRSAEKDAATRWPPGHFYSPGISRSEISQDKQRIFARKDPLALDMRDEAQLAYFRSLQVHFRSIPFQDNATHGLRYYYDNPSYNYGDAIIYWSLLLKTRPKRINEVGSGYSSALALDAADSARLETVCQFIDPYPDVARKATHPLNDRHSIIPSKVQDIDPDMVKILGEGDILFIDSSHVLKTGSDVHFELTQLLPRLNSGVIIHFHDVFESFEYPENWVLNLNHGWNEQYAIQLFLMYNKSFEILYFNHYFARRFPHHIRAIAPKEAPRILLNPGGGLWLRKV